MQVRISGTNLDKNFANWILDIIRVKIKGTISKKKLEPWEKYFKDNLKLITPMDTVIKKALDSLTYTFIDDSTISIYFDKNVYLVSDYKIETLCKTINFGTIDQKGYPIFTDTFNDLASNINDYIILYNLIYEEEES